MGRRKKINSVEVKENIEVNMSDTMTLENLEQEVDHARVELEKVKSELAEKKSELKSMPMREVDEDEMIIVKKQHSNTSSTRADRELIAKQKAFDDVMVTGKFINRRSPGNPAKLLYQKYEDCAIKWWTMEDGKVYTIPRGFADQINEYYHTPQFVQKQAIMDPNQPSSAIQEVDTSNKKYSFNPINF